MSSIYIFSYFPFGFEGRIWDLIVSVPDHCLSFYFSRYKAKSLDHEIEVTVTYIYFEVKSQVILTHNPEV